MVVGGMSDAVVLIEEMIPKLLLKTCPGVRQVDSSGHTLVQVVNESQQETITAGVGSCRRGVSGKCGPARDGEGDEEENTHQ